MRILKSEMGFTLIELVMIIVILGILAAVAIPRYINLKTEADYANAKGVVGALNSAASIAFAQYILDSTVLRCGQAAASVIDTPTELGDCLDGGLPANWAPDDANNELEYTDSDGAVHAFTMTDETTTSKARVAISDPPW